MTEGLEVAAAAFARRASSRRQGRARVSRYFSDPVLFAREAITWPAGEGLAPYQEEILRAVVSDFRVVARGPRGYGKSAGFALLIIWFALTREMAGTPWKIVTTAGAWAQLEDYLWPEVHLWARRVKWDVLGMEPWTERQLLTIGIKGRIGGATAANPKIAQRIEGGHAEQFLYVFDEAKLIPSTIWDSAEGSAASATGNRELRWVAQSSGGDADGRFFDLCTGKITGWWKRHVTRDEAIAAGRMNRAWADRMAELWGEGSAPYQNHVLGNFASTGGTASVIRLSDVEAAFERWRAWARAGKLPPPERPAFGVDVGTGNLNRDPATIARRHGSLVTDVSVHRFTDAYPEMQLAGVVNGLLSVHGGHAIIDAIGQGSGVVSRLRELGAETGRQHDVRAFVASGGSTRKDASRAYGFLNQRAELWWRLREDLADPESVTALPDDPILLGELTAPSWTTTSNSRIQIEAKDEIAKRLRKLESRKALDEGGSTNRADAVVMSWYEAGSINAPAAEALSRGPSRSGRRL